MTGLHTADQVRSAEAPVLAATPEGALMQRAATGLATACLRLVGRAVGVRVTLLVGAGDNGGDALWAGAVLARRGSAVTALLLDPDRAHAAGLAGLRRAGGRSVTDPRRPGWTAPTWSWTASPGSAVGAGCGRRCRRGRPGGRRPGLLVAVDVPSGVDADTGAVVGEAFPAQHTVTFGAVKVGLVVGEGRAHAGVVHLVDLGLDLPAPAARQLTDADVAARLPDPGAGDDKYSRGVVGVHAGSATYPGAAVLCTGARCAPGRGWSATPDGGRGGARRLAEAVVSAGRPVDAGRVQAWVVGPGAGTDDEAHRVLAEVLGLDLPVLVDADALTLVARDPGWSAGARRRPCSPRTTGSSPGSGTTSARPGRRRPRRAADLGATVLLKGDATVVADADGTVFVNGTGTPWLATAGTGDVLSGVVGALLATGLPAVEAAAAGAHLHGRAGQLAAAAGPLIASDVVRHLPAAVHRLTPHSDQVS